jgi:hypothetical protein
VAHIFISYRHDTVDFAYLLASRLEDAGFSVVINPDPRAGEGWSPWIDRVIGEALAVLALITPESGVSPFVAYEWAYALGAGIAVIPLVLSYTDMHPRLKALDPLDFSNADARPWPGLMERLWARADRLIAAHLPIAPDASANVKTAAAALSSHDGQARLTAVETLAAIPDPAARTLIVAAAQHPVYRAVRLAAVGALAQIKGDDALRGLLAAVRDPDTDVSRAAAHAVSAFGDAAVPGLVEIMNGGARAAIWALSLIATPSTVPGLIEALKMSGWFAPRTAAVTLGKIADPRAVPGLTEALDSEDESLRTLAAGALQKIGTPEALAALQKIGW